jgi:hypothetical protein
MSGSRLPAETSPESDTSKSQERSAWGIVTLVIERVRDEPFLFTIAIVALLIPLLVVAANLGSPDLRLVIGLVGVLAFISILARYVRDVLRDVQRFRSAETRAARKHELEMERLRSTESPGLVRDYVDSETDASRSVPESGEHEHASIEVEELMREDESMHPAKLRTLIVGRFDLEELRTLCFDLEVDFDGLRGEGLRAKARELVAYFQRRGKLPRLVAEIRRQRPDIEL